jgi:hypothetical protein
MTLPTQTFTSYAAVGNREDLENNIYLIDDFATPFLSSIDKVKADAVYHEWQTDALRAAAANTNLEGDDTAATAVTATARLGNYCQISKECARVSGTQEAVNKAGRKSEMAHQLYKKSKELMHDMELALLANNARNAGSAGVARVSAGVEACIVTNDVFDAGGASPTTSISTTRSDGTKRPLTEAMLAQTIKLCADEGGMPDTILVNSYQKQAITKNFTGYASRQVDAKDKKLVGAIDVYVSDFGTHKIVFDRFVRTRSLLALQMDMWAVAELRPFKIAPLAKTGDSEAREIITEFCLVSRNEKASGGVFDLQDS